MKASRGLADAVLADFDEGESVLLDVTRKRYHRLNRTGAAIWKGLEDGDDDAAIAARLMKEFDVSEADALAAVERFLGQLQTLGLLGA